MSLYSLNAFLIIIRFLAVLLLDGFSITRLLITRLRILGLRIIGPLITRLRILRLRIIGLCLYHSIYFRNCSAPQIIPDEKRDQEKSLNPYNSLFHMILQEKTQSFFLANQKQAFTEKSL